MPYAERMDDRIVLQIEFREKDLASLIPGIRWDSELKAWKLPLSWAGCCQLRGVFGPELQIGPNLNAWARDELAYRVNPCIALREAQDSEELTIFSALRPFQRAGAQFLATARHALIADEMGTGKTVQAITAMEIIGPDAYPALIVCPNSMKFTWRDEFAKWAPQREVSVINGSANERRKQIAQVKDGIAEVAVINFEGLRAHTRLAAYGQVNLTDEEKKEKELNEIRFRTVVADEGHRAKDPRAKQTRALWYVGDRANNRFALTGTPIANSPEDIWALMRFISPSEFPAKTKFIDRYALQTYNVFGFTSVTGLKSETREELFRFLDPRFIRRLKAQVLPQLPPMTYTTRLVEMGAKQKKAYEEMRKSMMAGLEDGTLIATNPLTHLIRLIQFASCYGKLENDQLVLTEPSCKIDALEEIVAELGDQQAVVFAESRQLIDLAAARLRDTKKGNNIQLATITGETPAMDRAEYVNQFQSGKLKLLLLTLGAGGEGITLTAAATAIFLQRSWSMIKNSQAEARIHRIGQEASSVNIVDVVTANSVEYRVHAARAEKAERMEELVRDRETLAQWLAK